MPGTYDPSTCALDLTNLHYQKGSSLFPKIAKIMEDGKEK